MNRFIVSILCVSVFFIGLGALADNVGAAFRSDDKALEIMRQARIAIGGEASIAEVRSMIITAKTSHTFAIGGTERTEQGETEIVMQMPDKLMKMVKIGNASGGSADKVVSSQHDVVVIRRGDGIKSVDETRGGEFSTSDGKKVIVRRIDGPEGAAPREGKMIIAKPGDEEVVIQTDGPHKKVLVDKVHAAEHGKMRQNELLRTTLGLLLTAPEGMDVTYTFAGERDVDGVPCNVIDAEFAGSNIKLFISKASSLPVMMSYNGHRMPKVFHLKMDPAKGEAGEKENVAFFSRTDGPGLETTEVQVRFSDFRGVGGIQLPYRWTTSVGGRVEETLDVTGYELNPANIADKFQQKVMLRKSGDQK